MRDRKKTDGGPGAAIRTARSGGRRTKAVITAVALTLLMTAFASVLLFENDNDNEDSVLAASAGTAFDDGTLRYRVTVADTEVAVIGFIGDPVILVVPEFVTNTDESPAVTYQVTSIGSNAFRECHGLSDITIPSSVLTIGNWAFAYCYALTSIDISSVVTIMDYAFYSCQNLATVVLDSARSIGNWAFYTWWGPLSSIDLSSVVTIGEGAFEGCNYLTTVDLSSAETVGYRAFSYTGINAVTTNYGPNVAVDGVLFNHDMTILMLYPSGKTDTSYTVPASVITIGDGAFHTQPYLNTIDSTSAISIGKGAFEQSYNLNTVNIGSAVFIGNYAFRECYNLVSVDIGSAVYIGEGTFQYCYSLTTVDLSSVEYIGMDAFTYTGIVTITVAHGPNIVMDGVLFNPDGTMLILYPSADPRTSYIIPSSVITIGDGAFAVSLNLTSITVPDSVKTVGNSAFRNCENLTELHLGSVEVVGFMSFAGCYGLTTVDLSSAKIIGHSVFSSCYNLTDIDLSSVITVGYAAFEGCYGLTTVDLSSVVNLGTMAFADCYGLTTVDLSSATIIGDGVFYGCTNLTTVNMSSALIIGDVAFYRCSNLTTVTMDSVMFIGNGAFNDCTNLTEITIPSSVVLIGNGAFTTTNISVLAIPYGTVVGANIVMPGTIIVWYDGAASVTAVMNGNDVELSISVGMNEVVTDVIAGIAFGGDDIDISENDGIWSFSVLDVPASNRLYVTIDVLEEVVPVLSYLISYDVNGGTGMIAGDLYPDGSAFAAASSVGLTAPAGMQFKHWNTAADGSGSSYAEGGLVTMPTGGMTLYAIWDVSAGGGTGGGASGSQDISAMNILLLVFIVLLAVLLIAYVLKRIENK